MQTEMCIHPSNIKHAEVNLAEGESLISLKVPANKAVKIADAIKGVLDLAGHKVRKVDMTGDELVDSDEIFANVTPGMILRGLRVKEDITQAELAERLSITQNMVSDMESGRRNISLKMARRISEELKVPYKMLV